MANYITNTEELTAVANAIRSMTDVDSTASYATIGKNLLNPSTMSAINLPIGTYVFSATVVTSIGEEPVEYTYTCNEQTESVFFANGSSGERITISLTVDADDTTFTFTKVSYLTDYQVESGSTATEYEPYLVKLDYPTGFVSEISKVFPCDRLIVKELTLTATLSQRTLSGRTTMSAVVSASRPADLALPDVIGFVKSSMSITNATNRWIGVITVDDSTISASCTIYNTSSNSLTISSGTKLNVVVKYYAYPPSS